MNKGNVEYSERKRHGFVTFWLVAMICVAIISLISEFSGTSSSFNNIMKQFGLASDFTIGFNIFQSIVYIISAFLLLNWKKIGFWLIVIIDVISAFVIGNGSFIIVWLVLYAIKEGLLFGILNIRKNGVSTWDYLKNTQYINI